MWANHCVEVGEFDNEAEDGKEAQPLVTLPHSLLPLVCRRGDEGMCLAAVVMDSA